MGSGARVEINFNEQQVDNAFIDFLDEIAPNIRRVFTEVTEQLQVEAKNNWPVRKRKSKGSIDNFERGLAITPDSVFAYFRNTSDYAWAIRMGAESKNRSGAPIMIPSGRRIANELMWKPAKKEADIIAEVLADDLAKAAG